MDADSLAVVAFLLNEFGSLIAIKAPGDGQTGCVTFPLWAVGGLMGFNALGKARAQEPDAWPLASNLAILAALSIAGSFIASASHSRRWKEERRAKTVPPRQDEDSAYRMPG